jgi:hypothetical protein
MINSGIPSRSTGVVVHELAPVQRAAFSSRVICAIRDWMFFISSPCSVYLAFGSSRAKEKVNHYQDRTKPAS